MGARASIAKPRIYVTRHRLIADYTWRKVRFSKYLRKFATYIFSSSR